MMQASAIVRRPVATSNSLRSNAGRRSNARPVPNSRKSTRTLASADDEVSTVAVAAAVVALPLELLCYWSEYTVVTTGEGLQGDVLGGLEGLAYLAVLAMVAWSLKTKVSTGSGLPAGPSGLIGASEGLAYLAVLGFAAFFFHN